MCCLMLSHVVTSDQTRQIRPEMVVAVAVSFLYLQVWALPQCMGYPEYQPTDGTQSSHPCQNPGTEVLVPVEH